MADHCRRFALSDPKVAAFRIDCDHEHDHQCDRCEEIMSVLDHIDGALEKQRGCISEDEFEELRFVVNQSKSSIMSWKAHILRSIHQDTARTDILASLDEFTIFVIQDWAMKYLPRKYRESQTDWFGKRGIPWHLSVAFRKVVEKLEIMTFCHIFKNVTQESEAVVAVMEDVVERLKKAVPSFSTLYYRQDNAGCYHSGQTIVSSSTLGKKAGVTLKRLDFSDPQGGKGACDRKAATIKSHMNIYLNAGHDISTPEQMCEAMLSSDGIPSLNVILCGSVKGEVPAYKIDGISLLSNIEYSTQGIRAWRAYGIGEGKIVKPKPATLTDSLPEVVVLCVHESSFSSVKHRTAKRDTGKAKTDQGNQPSVKQEEADGLFSCPEDGCEKTFLRHSSMLRHLDCGKHQFTLERETLFDVSARKYADFLEGGTLLLLLS